MKAQRARMGTAESGWIDEAGDRWVIGLQWAQVRGRAEVVGFSVRSSESGDAAQPISSALLRRINVSSMIDEKRREWAVKLRDAARLGSPDVSRRSAAQIPVFEAPRRARAALTAVELARRAKAYSDAWRSGSGDPTKALAEQWQCAYQTAAGWVVRLRKEGYLTATTPGRPGGTLTAKTKRILSKKEG